VRAKPRASKDRIRGLKEGMLEVSVMAPPVDGKANRAICAVLAKALGLSVSSVRVVSGESARIKRVEVSGLGWDDVARRLGLV
jgi:hypothetical protein